MQIASGWAPVAPTSACPPLLLNPIRFSVLHLSNAANAAVDAEDPGHLWLGPSMTSPQSS